MIGFVDPYPNFFDSKIFSSGEDIIPYPLRSNSNVLKSKLWEWYEAKMIVSYGNYVKTICLKSKDIIKPPSIMHLNSLIPSRFPNFDHWT